MIDHSGKQVTTANTMKNNSLLKNNRTRFDWETIFKETMSMGGARYFSLILGGFRGIILPKLLDPSIYGIWKGLNIICNFARFPQLGVASALLRQVPILRSQKKDELLKKSVEIAFSVNVINGLFVALIVFLVSFFIHDKTISLSMRLFTIMILLNELFMFSKNIYRL